MVNLNASFDDHGLQDRLRKVDGVMIASVNDALRAIARLFVTTKGHGPLPDETPVRTGALKRSSISQIVNGVAMQKVEIRQGARTSGGSFYGHFVREGTEPHEIRPVRAKALRFMIGNQVIFAMKVDHPGTRANPYHQRVYQRQRGRIRGIMQKLGKGITAYISGKSGGQEVIR